MVGGEFRIFMCFIMFYLLCLLHRCRDAPSAVAQTPTIPRPPNTTNLGRVDTERDEALGVEHRQLDDLPHLFDLLLAPADV